MAKSRAAELPHSSRPHVPAANAPASTPICTRRDAFAACVTGDMRPAWGAGTRMSLRLSGLRITKFLSTRIGRSKRSSGDPSACRLCSNGLREHDIRVVDSLFCGTTMCGGAALERRHISFATLVGLSHEPKSGFAAASDLCACRSRVRARGGCLARCDQWRSLSGLHLGVWR